MEPPPAGLRSLLGSFETELSCKIKRDAFNSNRVCFIFKGPADTAPKRDAVLAFLQPPSAALPTCQRFLSTPHRAVYIGFDGEGKKLYWQHTDSNHLESLEMANGIIKSRPYIDFRYPADALARVQLTNKDVLAQCVQPYARFAYVKITDQEPKHIYFSVKGAPLDSVLPTVQRILQPVPAVLDQLNAWLKQHAASKLMYYQFARNEVTVYIRV